MHKNVVLKISLNVFIVLSIVACQSDLEPQIHDDTAGIIHIQGYVTDTVQIKIGDELLEYKSDDTKFIKSIDLDYKFVYKKDETKQVDLLSYETENNIESYSFTANVATIESHTTSDTIVFFYTPGVFMKNVYDVAPGTLSQSGYVGYKFMFPTMNTFSNSGYEGALDGIITNYITKAELGVVENINTDVFSDFIEFPYGSPNIISVALVKHGTTESYIENQPVVLQMVMKKNKSRLIVLNEEEDEDGVFLVTGNMDLASYFDYK